MFDLRQGSRFVRLRRSAGREDARTVVVDELESLPAAAGDQTSLDNVLELADVPGPFVRLKRLHRGLRDLRYGHAKRAAVPLQEMADEHRDVLAPLPE